LTTHNGQTWEGKGARALLTHKKEINAHIGGQPIGGQMNSNPFKKKKKLLFHSKTAFPKYWSNTIKLTSISYGTSGDSK